MTLTLTILTIFSYDPLYSNVHQHNHKKPPFTNLPVKPPFTNPPEKHLYPPIQEAPSYHPTQEAPFTKTTCEAPTYQPTSEAPFYHPTSEAPITTPPVKPPITTPPANPLLPTREAPYYHPTREVPYYHPTHEAPFYYPTCEVPFYHSTQEAPFLPTHLWSSGSAGGRSSCSIVPSTQRGVVQTEHRLPTLTITKAARLKQHLMGVLQDVWGWSRRHVHMQGSTQGETQGWWGLLEHFWYAPFHFDIPVLIIPGWNCWLAPCWFAYYNKCEVSILRPEQLFLKCGKQHHEPKSKSSGFACRNSHTHTHTQPSTVLNKMFHRVLLKNPLLILHKCSRTPASDDEFHHYTLAKHSLCKRIRAIQNLDRGTTLLLQRPSSVGAMQRLNVGGRWLTPSATAMRRLLHFWWSSASWK